MRGAPAGRARQPAQVAELDQGQNEGIELGQLARREGAEGEDRARRPAGGRIAAALEEGGEEPAAEGAPRRAHGGILSPLHPRRLITRTVVSSAGSSAPRW